MREGLNPNKDKIIYEAEFLHQIIIPVYIPHLKDYFEESFEILKICIQSLRNTSHSKTFISLISNGSCHEVEEYLRELYIENVIHEVVITSNVGKYNAILKGLAGHNFNLVTIADADVFFKTEWQNETYKIFNNFPRTGAVGLIPQFLSYQSHSENLLYNHILSNKVRFGEVEEPKALAEFYDSLGWDANYPKDRLRYILYLKSKHAKALVGSGHVVITFRRELLENISLNNPYKMGGDSEEILDRTVPESGYYRLTTSSNFARHLGNKLDKKLLVPNPYRSHLSLKNFPDLPKIKMNRSQFIYLFKRKFMQLILKSHKLRMVYLSYLGLPRDVRKSF